MFGKKEPIVGKAPVNKLSPFLGSVITPENHREYRNKQAEYYIQQVTKDVVSGREAILANEEGKSPEEIDILVEEYNAKQPNEAQLETMAHRFAAQMVTKEKAHYKAYLRGDSFFEYKGNKYPVITEKMVTQTQSIHEIIKKLEDARFIREGSNEGSDPLTSPGDIPEGDNETIRSESSDQEDSGSQERGPGDEGRTDEVLSVSSGDLGQ